MLGTLTCRSSGFSPTALEQSSTQTPCRAIAKLVNPLWTICHLIIHSQPQSTTDFPCSLCLPRLPRCPCPDHSQIRPDNPITVAGLQACSSILHQPNPSSLYPAAASRAHLTLYVRSKRDLRSRLSLPTYLLTARVYWPVLPPPNTKLQTNPPPPLQPQPQPETTPTTNTPSPSAADSFPPSSDLTLHPPARSIPSWVKLSLSQLSRRLVFPRYNPSLHVCLPACCTRAHRHQHEHQPTRDNLRLLWPSDAKRTHATWPPSFFEPTAVVSCLTPLYTCQQIHIASCRSPQMHYRLPIPASVGSRLLTLDLLLCSRPLEC